MKDLKMAFCVLYLTTLMMPLLFLKFFWGFGWGVNLIGIMLLGFHTLLWVLAYRQGKWVWA